jgi:hypothetical protein
LVSPLNGEEITEPGPVTLEWTVPGYSNSFSAVLFSLSPTGFLSGSGGNLPPVFLNGADTSLAVPGDYGLQPSWYFWSVLHVVFGYDSTTFVLVAEQDGSNMFMYTDPALPAISGTVTQTGGFTEGPVFIMMWDGDPYESTPVSTARIDDLEADGSYTLPNISVPADSYTLSAFRDTSGNLEESDGEGVTLSPVIVNFTGSDMSSQNLVLEELELGSISGEIGHAAVNGGIESGSVMLVATETATFEMHIRLLPGPGPFTIRDLPDGTYAVYAFRDANMNYEADTGEGAGSFAGGTVDIADADDLIGIDITLVEQ